MTHFIPKPRVDVIIYNQSHKPNLTGYIMPMFNSKKQFEVLVLYVLVNNKKSLIKISNGETAINGIRSWNSSTLLIVGSFKYAKVCRGNREYKLKCP